MNERDCVVVLSSLLVSATFMYGAADVKRPERPPDVELALSFFISGCSFYCPSRLLGFYNPKPPAPPPPMARVVTLIS